MIMNIITLILYIACAVGGAVMAYWSHDKINKVLYFIFFGWFSFCSIIYIVMLVTMSQ